MTCSIQVVDSAWFFGQMLLLHYDRESSAQLFVGFVAVIDEVTTDLIACRSVVGSLFFEDSLEIGRGLPKHDPCCLKPDAVVSFRRPKPGSRCPQPVGVHGSLFPSKASPAS